MLPGQPSRTLLPPAVRRAAHQLLDTPRIFDDPVAVGLLPETSEHAIFAGKAQYCQPEPTLVRTWFALRSRFVEDRLAQSAARGVEQYVILGAGLDTFAWRQPDYAHRMGIFAVDHVESLAWTQVRFWERGLPKPPNLTFVPADLEQCGLGAQLAAFGFNQDMPSFFSVLGVTQYLDRNAVNALIAYVASLKAGSELVFTFIPPDAELGAADVQRSNGFATLNKSLGEPWKTRLPTVEVIEQLSRFGFRDVFHLSPSLAHTRYFANRQDGLRVPEWEQLIAAIV